MPQCVFIKTDNHQCKNRTDDELCTIHIKQELKRQDALFIINLVKTNEELKLDINTLNDIIQKNKVAYDDIFKKYHELLTEYSKLIESAKLIMNYNEKFTFNEINFKNEIKNLNISLEKKNKIILDLKKNQKIKLDSNFLNYKFDTLYEEFKQHCQDVNLTSTV
jgi:hypothetical protein